MYQLISDDDRRATDRSISVLSPVFDIGLKCSSNFSQCSGSSKVGSMVVHRWYL